MQETQTIARISGLEDVTSGPSVIFALADGNHPKAVQAVSIFREIYANDIQCVIFSDSLEIRRHMEKQKIPRERGLIILEDRQESGCFSLLCNIHKLHGRLFPNWASAVLWGLALHHRISEDRIKGAARQIKAIFGDSLAERLDKGELPWGAPPKAKAQSNISRRYRSSNHMIW